MKVALRVVVDVEVDTWADVYGTERTAAAVRDDVRSYFQEHVGEAPAVVDAGLTVVAR